ncbi:hypothetical protein ABE61_16185 [Lysinibacillus sphaericus]|uniref:hypothetical protein n=1 Tax=Lysinibacillus sphaericus TaxID=1421 RepID=UPI0018CD2191|nr:hypothetical protein [Lysinibacillus sphaericus]MBG9477977.1 hypothetical protein [Lysinibacillus sphaericus]MBG9594117.1 hypothetical protein [Lysinibacillus sphaericus]
MNPADTYNLCCQYHGKRVRIEERSGRVHYGEITRVDRRQVWILPDRRFGGYGLGWGWGFGGAGAGFGIGIAFGVVAGIALAPLLFW